MTIGVQPRKFCVSDFFIGREDLRYARIAKIKNMELKSSALPTTPVTASVCIGCMAKRKVDIKDIDENS